MAVRRPKPLIPLRTALDKVSSSNSTVLSVIPAVLMLTSIASARKGDRTTSITTDARFVVVLAFILGLSARLVMRCVLPRDEQDIYNRCAIGPLVVLRGL